MNLDTIPTRSARFASRRVQRSRGVTMRSLPWLLVLLLTIPSAVLADEPREIDVQAFDPEGGGDDEESLLEEARRGPQAQASWVVEAIPFEQIERTDAAISQLRRLIDRTPTADEARADLMFRLAELYYDRARFYEQRAFQRRDEAAVMMQENPARARAFQERANDDLQQSDAFADRAIELYAEIVRLYGTSYENIDAVLYFLGANLAQLQRTEEARQVFEVLVQEYPRSSYIPAANYQLGEYHFSTGNMELAYAYFEAVMAFPELATYPLAAYKRAWTLYNLARSPRDFEDAVQALLDVVQYLDGAPQAGRQLLRRDALRDMALFYSEVYPADRALGFFEQIAPNDAFDLVARLARIYGEKGRYADSNALYRELIRLRPNTFEIVGYQREIARNTAPSGDIEAYLIELRRLVEVFVRAREFPDAQAGRVQSESTHIELLLRQAATTYHREAQVTLNEAFYAYAYNLYEDWARHFSEGSPHAYTMWFYYAQLLYRNRDWARAAAAYDRVLALSTVNQRQYNDEAILASCIAYTRIADLENVQVVGGTGQAGRGEDELPPVPVPRPLPETFEATRVACDRYVETGVNQSQVAAIDFALAYTLYEYNHLEEAIPRFGALATDFVAVDRDRAQASAELLLDSYALLRRYEEMGPWIARFRAGPLNVGEFAVRLAYLSEQINFRICRAMQDEGRHGEAGLCFIAFAENHIESALLDRALYNAGLAFENAGEFEFALDAYAYLIQFRPNSEIVPDTLFVMAGTYRRIAIYDESAHYFERYAEIRPNSENAPSALASAAQFRMGLGQYDQALRTLQSYVRLAGRRTDVGPEAVAEAHYQMASIQLARGRTNDAITAYERFVRDHGRVRPDLAIQALGNLARLREDQRARRDVIERAHRSTLAFYDELSEEAQASLSPAALDAAARAQFALADSIFAEFDAVQIRGNEAAIRAAVQRKVELGTQAREAFELVTRFRRPGWTIAAFTRVGQLYEFFYLQLRDAPVPPGLSLIQEDAYRSEIDERADGIKAQSVELYLRAIEISQRFRWYNEYSELAARNLQTLVPEFRAGAEMRMSPGFSSQDFFRSAFVTSLERDDRARIGRPEEGQ